MTTGVMQHPPRLNSSQSCFSAGARERDPTTEGRDPTEDNQLIG